MIEEIKAWLSLAEIPNIGSGKSIRLAQILGHPTRFMGKSLFEDKRVNFLDAEQKRLIAEFKDPKDWNKTVEIIEEFEIKFCCVLDEEYPPMLANIYNPPPFLFYRGSFEKQDFSRSFAIVGTRKASNYGKIIANRISRDIAKKGMTIVSGLALGIDSMAHSAALDAGGRTIAVLGTGCEQIYPPQNRNLFQRILENGVLVSEFIPGSKPEKWNFPTRNRIISGLSIGVWVVEGAKKSGALLTSKFALEQNRDIFALPGDVNRPQAEGPNYLLKLGGKIVCSAEDILEEYDFIVKDETQLKIFPEMNEKETFVYRILLQNKPELVFDELLLKSQMSVGELSTAIFSLEMKSVVKKMPGNKIAPLF